MNIPFLFASRYDIRRANGVNPVGKKPVFSMHGNNGLMTAAAVSSAAGGGGGAAAAAADADGV